MYEAERYIGSALDHILSGLTLFPNTFKINESSPDSKINMLLVERKAYAIEQHIFDYFSYADIIKMGC